MVAADNDAPSFARKLGIESKQLVQEFGWDEDADDDIRVDVEEAAGSELLDEDTDEVVDVVLLWWRDGDGDLVSGMDDATDIVAESVFLDFFDDGDSAYGIVEDDSFVLVVGIDGSAGGGGCPSGWGQDSAGCGYCCCQQEHQGEEQGDVSCFFHVTPSFVDTIIPFPGGGCHRLELAPGVGFDQVVLHGVVKVQLGGFSAVEVDLDGLPLS